MLSHLLFGFLVDKTFSSRLRDLRKYLNTIAYDTNVVREGSGIEGI